MSLFKRFIGHFKTITRHRHKVIVHCAKAGIFWQGLRHDLSKYSLKEFIPGVKYYTGTKSPNEGERAAVGYSVAWLHHKGRNKHHYEYWVDYNIVTKQTEPVAMPYRYVVEMFCDRVAASKIYNKENYRDNSSLEYYNQKAANRKIHEQTKEELEIMLYMLAEKGEEETFRYIKNEIRRRKSRKEVVK